MGCDLFLVGLGFLVVVLFCVVFFLVCILVCWVVGWLVVFLLFCFFFSFTKEWAWWGLEYADLLALYGSDS